jgi:hypothetical protein
MKGSTASVITGRVAGTVIEKFATHDFDGDYQVGPTHRLKTDLVAVKKRFTFARGSSNRVAMWHF